MPAMLRQLFVSIWGCKMYRRSWNWVARLAFGVALWGCHWISAQAQAQWYGTYVAESTGVNATQTRSWVKQESLEVSRAGDNIVAVYGVTMNGDSLDLSERWIGHDFGDSIAFTFDRCLSTHSVTKKVRRSNDNSMAPRRKPKEGSCTNQYKYGDPMLTFVDRVGFNNQKILFTKFRPE